MNYSMSVRNQRFILDNTLRVEKQVNSICKSCYYQIQNDRLIHKYINDGTCKSLVQALIFTDCTIAMHCYKYNPVSL